MIIQGILLLNQTTEESVKKNSGGGLGIKQNKIPTISKALTGRPKPGGGRHLLGTVLSGLIYLDELFFRDKEMYIIYSLREESRKSDSIGWVPGRHHI